jgi:hypothetical protein
MNAGRDSEEKTERSTLQELWAQYKAVNALVSNMQTEHDARALPEQRRITFEVHALDPILTEAHELAMRIAEAKCTEPSEIAIKASVLLDYLDPSEGDALQSLALSLCQSTFALCARP